MGKKLLHNLTLKKISCSEKLSPTPPPLKKYNGPSLVPLQFAGSQFSVQRV